MSVLLLLALAQAPTDVPVAIVVASRRDTGTVAAAVCDQLKVALAAQGIQATSDAESVERITKLGGVDPRACDGSRLCLQKLAQLLQGVVIGVDVSKAGKLSAGHFEAVTYDRVDSLAAVDVTADAKGWKQKSVDAANELSAKLKGPVTAMNEARRAKTVELKKQPELDTPREPTLVPAPPPTPPAAVAVEGKPGEKGPVPWVILASSLVSAGVGVPLIIWGVSDLRTYDDSYRGVPGTESRASSLKDDQLDALASGYHAKMGLGIGLIGLAVALGITTAFLFLKD